MLRRALVACLAVAAVLCSTFFADIYFGSDAPRIERSAVDGTGTTVEPLLPTTPRPQSAPRSRAVDGTSATVERLLPTTPRPQSAPRSRAAPRLQSGAPASAGAALPGQAVPIRVADGEGKPIGAIEVPKLGLVRYLFEGVQLTTLDRGPGHWPGTAMPGEAGNVVFAGHRISHNADFADLHKLAPDDEVIFAADGDRHRYRVVSTEIVEPNATWIANQTEAPTATLFACHPPGSVSQRIVVHLALD